jgi:peroxiredoxin
MKITMQFQKFLLILCCVFTLLSCSKSDPVLHDTENHEVQLSKLKNKWVIINVWAAWCPSCIFEIPAFNHFYQHNKDKNVLVYGVSYDPMSLDELKQTMDKVQIKFPVLTEDPTQVWHLGDVSVLPTTFIINPKGHVVKTLYGANSEEKIVNTLKTLQASA